MNLRVFKIWGNAQRSKRKVKFTGCFVKMEGSDTIEGYMEEKGYTPYDPVRYIKGIYIEEEQRLAFAVMCNNMITLQYVFSTLKNKGVWDPERIISRVQLEYLYGFNYVPSNLGTNERQVSIQMEEVLDDGEKNALVQKVATVKEKDSNIGSRSYQEFHECVKTLLSLLEHYGRVPSIINRTPNVSKKERTFGKISNPSKDRKLPMNPKRKKKRS